MKKLKKWYQNNIQTVIENVNRKLTWGMVIQCDIVESKPDIVIVNKMEKTAIIIDVAKSGDKVITGKENKMIEKYRNLKKKD